ncbi:MAG: ParB N-terminal domain-containing protein [Planctomycetes bacterium]|nr:ParB N-terminal domain-containing protein [Planctomycetota bacterium]
MTHSAAPPLVIESVALESLIPSPQNPRIHGEHNLAAIRASLEVHGQLEPLVVQSGTLRILAGHGRVEAMRSLGWTHCQIVAVDVTDTEAKAIGVALNRTGELATWDLELLSKILEELRVEEALAGSGYSEADLDALVKEVAAQAGPRELEDPGPSAPPAKAVSRRGDLWILGEHRLLCGDSTKTEDVDRLMGDERAALAAFDPPYLVDYTGERPDQSGKDWSATYKEIEISDAEGFFRAVFTQVLRVLAPHAAIYTWHAHKRLGLIQQIWEEVGILDAQQIVWVKPTSVFGRAFWHYQHEPCVMGWRKGSMPPHDGQHEFTSVWTVDWDGKARVVGNEHPTEKPVELFARPMRKHTQVGDLCFEPFSGSGSQLIAAERERRRCRAIEIEPTFVDVAIERWQTATQQKAVLAGDGRTFEALAKERLA